MVFSNVQVAKMLRDIAAALTLKHENLFQIRAYENVASVIENLTSEIGDLWEEEKLDSVPGIGAGLKAHLNELFKTGRVKLWEIAKKEIEPATFEFLRVTGVGPKTAQKLAQLGAKDLKDLRKKIKSGELASKGFSAKLAQNILGGLLEVREEGKRMLLPYATVQADKILSYLKRSPDVLQAHPLGSLRRMVATIGDLDFSVSSNEPKQVVDYFCKMPGIARILDQGESKATVKLNSGIQADLLVGKPQSYGALLQHFTGSKPHNIHLRIIAGKKGLSLSEYGVKKVQSEELIPTKTEEEFYQLLGMQTPPPEIREDGGEIEAVLTGKLPGLVKLEDIKGDLHLHSSFPIENPSHGPGSDSIEDIVKKAESLGYEFAGIADHPPGFSTAGRERIIEWTKKRTKFIQNLKKKTKSIRVLNGLEVDIQTDGNLSVPEEALKTLDFCIAGIHSGHRGSKEEITNRLLKALESPYIDIISHPTNRLLNERESSDADWELIFKSAAKNNKLLEINAYPKRLDLRDDLVRMAKGFGVKFIINTDAHAVSQMDNMKFGVSVARRGWTTQKDIVNSWDWTSFAEWFNI